MSLNFNFDQYLLENGCFKDLPKSDKKTENLNFRPTLRGSEEETQNKTKTVGNCQPLYLLSGNYFVFKVTDKSYV